MKETNWLKDCELCNAGVCKRIDELKEQISRIDKTLNKTLKTGVRVRLFG